MALLESIILGLIMGWLAFVVGLLIGWTWKPRWASSSSTHKVKLHCSAPRSFDLFLPSPSPRSLTSPLKGFGSAPCLKALVCDTWTMALRQQTTISHVFSPSSDSFEHVDVIAGVKKAEERLPNTVKKLDLRHLVQLVDREDGGHAWIQIMDRFTSGMRYQAWLREPKIAQRNNLDVDVDLALGFGTRYGQIETVDCLVEEGHAIAFSSPLMWAVEKERLHASHRMVCKKKLSRDRAMLCSHQPPLRAAKSKSLLIFLLMFLTHALKQTLLELSGL